MGRRKDQAQFNMRLSKPLLKRLQNAAKDQDRSLNSEMVHRLEHSFAPAEEAITFLRNLLRGMLEDLGPGELSDLSPPVPGEATVDVVQDANRLSGARGRAGDGGLKSLENSDDPDGGNVIKLMDALRQTLGRAPTIEELHALRRRALQVEPSDEEPELPMLSPSAPRKSEGGKS
jgi:hypothetical protein